MANFGWAYVDCEEGGQAAGPTGSVQFLTGNNATSGSANLVYHTASVYTYHPNTLVLSGNMVVTGTISASTYHIEDITLIDATGSTYFGNTNDDTHMRTGSLVIENVAANVVLSASAQTRHVSVAGFAGGYRAVSSTNVALETKYHLYGVTRTSATILLVPSASTVPVGLIWTIKDEVPSRTGASNNITLTGSGGGGGAQLFDNEGTYVLTGTMPAISLYSNGTNWFVF